VSSEAQYLLVIVGLFIVPRALQRYRLPSAITCVALGAVLGMGFGLFGEGQTIPTLATLGIVSLFLFAGLEVDFRELAARGRVTLAHLVVQVLVLGVASALLAWLLDLAWRPALVMALAIATPSTGFILDSLPGFGLSPDQRAWVKTKAIATEFLALAALFVTVQSTTASKLGLSTVAIVALVAVLPYLFQFFAARVLPFAPKSEFAFLLILALVSASITRSLGVYYLVGAFVVGVTAVRLRKRIPELATDRLMSGIELFASFFVPFYFFKAGLSLHVDDFDARALGLGVALVAVVVPLRVGLVAWFRHAALGESLRDGARVGLSLVPTLVFTLVLAGILRDQYVVPSYLFGGLVVFALVNTLIPGIVLRTGTVELVQHEAPRTPSIPDPPRPG
jgi:Kef-type K+ transport system membrane component KefB